MKLGIALLRITLFRPISVFVVVFSGWICTGSSIAQRPIDADAFPVQDLLTGEMVSIFAKNESLRRYGERFSKTVYDAAYETTGEPAGKGLVIIGNPKHPHPIMLIKKYLEIGGVEGSTLDALGIAPELREALEGWEEAEKEVKKEVGVDVESIVHVIPMPLEGALLNLYLVAREADFDEERIDERFADLSVSELQFGDFEKYDWVIYLPPKNALDKVLKEVLPKAMKKHKIGFFKRALVRGAVFTFKPLIRDAMEGVRKSLLYDAILKSTSDLNKGDREALTEAYREALMPRGKLIPSGSRKQSAAFDAIREQKKKNAEYAKDPFVAPEATIEMNPDSYSRFEGVYLWDEKKTVSVYQENSALYYKNGDDDPIMIRPTSEKLFVTEKKDMTFEFLANQNGEVSKIELRKERWRKTIHRTLEQEEDETTRVAGTS